MPVEGSLGGASVENLPASAGDVREQVGSLAWEDPLEDASATHSSMLAWRIPRTEEPGRHGPWGHKESDTTNTLFQ